MEQRLQQNYLWLLKLPDLPKMVALGMKLLGTKEIKGKKHNPIILAWAKELGLDKIYKEDEMAWCALFIGYLAMMCGKPNPLKSYDLLRALKYAEFGEPVPPGQEKLGDLLIFRREEGGHVGMYIGEDSAAFHVLGANQGDEVNIARLGRTRLYACRRPHYNKMPASVRKYFVSPVGQLSVNEK